MARATLRREALPHLELVYIFGVTERIAHTCTIPNSHRHGIRVPLQEQNLRATVLPPVEHGKSKFERRAMFVQKYSDSPLVPTKLVPVAVISAQISPHTSVTTSLALGPRARHVDMVDIADPDPAGARGARARRRLAALSGFDRDWDLARVAAEVLERDVARVARATAAGRRLGRRAAEGSDAGAVFGVGHGDVLDEDVGDDVFCAGVLA